ncbi:hypothetical protein C8R47DRAFT_1065851 [Mycena vitilis]|nr:hypothetical protein C8R47DRAFT_1065851 [Mycena vitilis]
MIQDQVMGLRARVVAETGAFVDGTADWPRKRPEDDERFQVLDSLTKLEVRSASSPVNYKIQYFPIQISCKDSDQLVSSPLESRLTLSSLGPALLNSSTTEGASEGRKALYEAEQTGKSR